MFKKILFSAVTASVMLMGSAALAKELRIGAKSFAEQQLLAEMTEQLLNGNGIAAKSMTGMGSSLLRQAMENKQVDLCWEYTGTSLITYNKVTERLSPEQTYERVKELDGKLGMVWLNPAQASNSYALAKRGGELEEINTISDLASSYQTDKALKLASTTEFAKRSDGLLGLQKEYDFRVGRANLVSMHPGLIYPALQEGQVDIGVVFSTDGRVASMNFTILEDDQNFFPSYNMTPVVLQEVADTQPEVVNLLNRLSAVLDNPTMQRLNGEVAVNKKSVQEVAQKFLQEQGLIAS
ncbi:glycine betaine ABC transporter substrate-binding protein [Alcaligenes endophyticus]|uniref:Glycine/betaine ABC transporter substrate-binding protein n=1 Tax=Alcaligenes endophyticus TaxID=1929088 RepID=A0ABT8EN26_9BURK|nr:glycine betaine ABC transporter substrate-binding protein [Alcaligenes endophyticus]MCX5591411.1 glycine/betaine ABC transporter substrate-binding protein [Alcaligenes endophyticus]MDN4122708.1 glycine/betaine ABC transporter substrate-binding protein [Alcaligenes endophyticus]